MECFSLQNPFTARQTTRQVPQQEDLNSTFAQLRNLDLNSIHSTRSYYDTYKTDSSRSLSVSFNDSKTIRDKLKEMRTSTILSNRNARSISPFKQSFCEQASEVLSPFQQRRLDHPGDYTPPNKHSHSRIEANSFQEAHKLLQKEKNDCIKMKNSGQMNKRPSDCSFTWQEEEEDSRSREGSTIEDDSLREDEIREKLLQLQEDIIKKQKLKGRSIRSSRQMDSSSFFNDTLLTIGGRKPSVSPPSLSKILTSMESSSNQHTNKKIALQMRKNKNESISSAQLGEKSLDMSIDTNENYAKIVRLESTKRSLEESKNLSVKRGRSKSPALPSNVSASVVLGCTKLQLFFQQVKFRNLNSSFRSLREKPFVRETFRGGELSRREASQYETPFSFRTTCVSFISEKHSDIHLGTVKLRNVLNKNVQTAFFELKSFLSFQKLQYKASIASGAIVLSKLFRARERTLLLQCFSLWQLRDALQVQRDKELAQRDIEIKRLSKEKDIAFFTLAEERDKRISVEYNQQDTKGVIEARKPPQARSMQISDKENAMSTPTRTIFQVKTPEKVIPKEKGNVIKKSSNVLDETRMANQLLYEQLKALYDKKCFEDTNREDNQSKPLRALNDNTPYQKPFILGQPKKSGAEHKMEGMMLNIKTTRLTTGSEVSVESDGRSSRANSRAISSKRSSVVSSAYNSSGLDSQSGYEGNRRDSNRFWGL